MFLATGRGGEGRRLAFLLSLKSECSDIKKLVGSQRKISCSFKTVVGLDFFLFDSILEFVQNFQGAT